MEEDTGIVERYRSGDNDAIEELVMKYQKQMYAFVYRIVNDQEEAKDLTQKTFLKADREGLKRSSMNLLSEARQARCHW